MTQHESDEPSVKIVDKRRFSADGESKESEESHAQESSNSEDSTVQNTGTDYSSNNSEQYERDSGQQELTFSAFIMSLATQVLSMLGDIPSPESAQVNVNLEAAKQSIDILALLEEKTKGNRTPEEDRLMEEVVPSLKMAFVRKVK